MNGIKSGTIPEKDWFVTEKIHGANLCIGVSKEGVKFYSRNQLIENTSKFFSLHTIEEELTEKAHNIWMDSLGNEVYIVGEIYGGRYPHEDVEVNPAVKTVQKGVYYSSDTQFRCFDIRLNDSTNTEAVANQEFLFFSDTIKVCNNFGLDVVPVLFKGSLEKCLQVENKFITKIPEMNRLPALEGNYAEGVVIRPDVTVFMDNGSRCILKSKIDFFSENKVKDKPKINKKTLDKFPEIDILINKNRISSAVSKLPEFEMPKSFGALLKEMNVDILSEIKLPEDKQERKIISKYVNTQCAQLIKQTFMF
jgi:Rnl2 family RNA ligase